MDMPPVLLSHQQLVQTDVQRMRLLAVAALMGIRYRKYEVEKLEDWTEWIRPLPGFRMACCDCGLVHEMEFDIGESDKGKKGVILFRLRRLLRATRGMRRRITREKQQP